MHVERSETNYFPGLFYCIPRMPMIRNQANHTRPH